MVAFAANSLLCREALRGGAVDAATFTLLRTLSAAVTLALLLWLRDRRLRAGGSPLMAAMLFIYMVGFSFAYLELTAATGALLLFGAVQLTMFAVLLLRGERLSALAWLGLALAVAGLVYLLLPGAAAPAPLGAVLMIAAGIAWGVYSLLGRSAVDPLAVTTGNFLLAVPAALLVLWLAPLLGAGERSLSVAGLALAVTSGALASGVGYVLWYAALRELDAGRAATVQLSVPIIAALGGVTLLAEPLAPRLVIASALTLGGIWLVLSRPSGRLSSATGVNQAK
jgi:drug/metabolite transporter (DMT)-like permease